MQLILFLSNQINKVFLWGGRELFTLDSHTDYGFYYSCKKKNELNP